MPLPQFPNVFYGKALYAGVPATSRMTVTAVTGLGTSEERHFTLDCRYRGLWGWPNGLKLKVGGVPPNLEDNALVQFYVTEGPLEYNTDLAPAGHSHFYDDGMPHITRLSLCQH